MTRLLVAAFAASALAASAQASDMRIFAQLPDQPEGLALDKDGVLYASTHAGQTIYRVADDGSSELVATVPSEEAKGHGEALGMEFDANGDLIVAYTEHSAHSNLFDPFHAGCRDATVTASGVYRVKVETGEVTPVVTKADGVPFCYPDDVDIDKAGNIYLSDLTYAGIWKITPEGEATLWSADPLLNKVDDAAPMGVNVVVLDRAEENIFAATTTVPGRIVRIPINADGSAGQAVAHSLGHTYFDGIDIDDEGYIYAAESGINQITIVAPEAGWLGLTARRVAGEGDPLQGPTSIVVKDGTIYTANLAFGMKPEQKNKAIVAITGYEKP